MEPADFSRRILLAVTGLTPQIVTETLYALTIQSDPPFIPTEVHVITTAEGAERARLSLLDPKSGHFHAFCAEQGLSEKIAFPPAHIHIITDAAGRPLQDIRTPEDNLRSADFIAHHVREFCRDSKAALHVSIAGGRKSMGFFIGYSLSLFGRAQDRLSHVLVSEPFESHRDFYYPPKEGKILHDRNERPVSTADARIMLAEIPFVRLRGGIPPSLQKRDISFSEAIGLTQAGLAFVSLAFDLPARTLLCGGQAIKLPPDLFAFYLWLAVDRVANKTEDSLLVWRDRRPEEFLTLYKKIQGACSDRYEKAETALKNGFDESFIEPKISKLNRKLREALPLECSRYQIERGGKKPNTGYRLALPAGCITLPADLNPT